MKYKQKTRLTYGAFLAVPLTLLAAMYIYPATYSFVMSLHSWDGISSNWTFVGFEIYAKLFDSSRFWHSLANNFRWLAFDLLVPTGVGLGLALLLDEKLRGVSLFKIIFFLPFTMTPVAVGTIWQWIYKPSRGVLPELLNAVGLSWLDQNWLGSPTLVNYSIMFAALWWRTGFAFLIYFAGLRNLPSEYVDAARVDGASRRSTFWQVMFPLLWPSTVVVLGISGVDAMRVFDIVKAMTQGGPYYSSDVLATQMYDASFANFMMGQGAAIAVCLMVAAAAVILPYIIYLASRVEDIRE